MPTDQHSSQGRRPNFRHRRGHERRGERRPAPAPQQTHEQPHAEQANVDQIIKEIKARISQRHGIDLSAPQIQELAARRLEAILDPRTVKPGLLDQLRRAAGAPADIAPPEPADAYTFEDHTIYDTHNGLLRFFRKLLNPLLKLFFNPNPLAAALNTQTRINREAAKREAERERTQAEWNALHYTLLQRLVTEISRTSIEMQSLAQRIEALGTRTDLTERRMRALETTPPPAPPSRTFDAPASAPPPRQQAPERETSGSSGSSGSGSSSSGSTTSADGSADGARRRRRRRRGRRGTAIGEPGGNAPAHPQHASTDAADADGDDDGFDDTLDAVEAPDAPDAAIAPPAVEAHAPIPAAAPVAEVREAYTPPAPVEERPAPPVPAPAFPPPAEPTDS